MLESNGEEGKVAVPVEGVENLAHGHNHGDHRCTSSHGHEGSRENGAEKAHAHQSVESDCLTEASDDAQCAANHDHNEESGCTFEAKQIPLYGFLSSLFFALVSVHVIQQVVSSDTDEHDENEVFLDPLGWFIFVAQVISAIVESITHIIGMFRLFTGKEEMSCKDKDTLKKVISVLLILFGVTLNESFFAYNRFKKGKASMGLSLGVAVFYYVFSVPEAFDVFAHGHGSTRKFKQCISIPMYAAFFVMATIASTAELLEKNLSLEISLLRDPALGNMTLQNMTAGTGLPTTVPALFSDLMLLDEICPEGVSCYLFGGAVALTNTLAFYVYYMKLAPESLLSLYSHLQDHAEEIKAQRKTHPGLWGLFGLSVAIIVLSTAISPWRAGAGMAEVACGFAGNCTDSTGDLFIDRSLNAGDVVQFIVYLSELPQMCFYASHVILELLEIALRASTSRNEHNVAEGTLGAISSEGSMHTQSRYSILNKSGSKTAFADQDALGEDYRATEETKIGGQTHDEVQADLAAAGTAFN